VLYSLFKTGIDGNVASIDNLRQASRYLPDNIYSRSTISRFRVDAEDSRRDVQGRFADLKKAAADRCRACSAPSSKGSEVQYHHEVYNQALWNRRSRSRRTRSSARSSATGTCGCATWPPAQRRSSPPTA
jgi:glutamine synthetase